ncbi:MAG: 5-(carboxyamino)imidazole ribonucleotide mutase [Gracilibacteraceae bacterium]|jgi:5-(carboxyamino)imidazole ribonucleotide mutase|nr:5-(carboxyamino)imidazole ribonucleotide mutase [Gracilibacteraceae bacterium]
MAAVGIIMGSDSDYGVMEEAARTLEEFGVDFEVKVSSAHRTLGRTVAWAEAFAAGGGQVIIAAAGMAAHLAGVIAGAVTLPVIGVPIQSGALAGVDALYATVQMPPGIPVAAVGINGAKNAALLAVQILAAGRPELRTALAAHRTAQAAAVEEKDRALAARRNGAKP